MLKILATIVLGTLALVFAYKIINTLLGLAIISALVYLGFRVALLKPKS